MKDPKKNTIRVVIVDDHPGVRMGLRALCSQENDISVEGEGSTGIDAMYLVRTVQPDVLLLDVEIPIFKGYKVVNRIRELDLEVQVLAVSSHHNPYLILEMLENGAAGYITKDEVVDWLPNAIRYVASGEKEAWLSPTVKEHLAQYDAFQADLTG